MCPPRRRDILAIAAGTATTLPAGCLSTGGDTTTTSGTGDSTATTTDGPAGTTTGSGGATATVDGDLSATAWLPAGSVFDGEPLFVFAGDLTAPRAAGVTDDALARTYDTVLPLPGDVLAGEDVTEFASLQRYATACRFTVPTSTVRDRLADVAGPTATAGEGTPVAGDADGDDTATGGDGGEPRPNGDAPDGYEGYVTPSGVYWVGADHLVYGRQREFAKALFDAHAGDVDRYAANQDLAAVLDATGDVDLFGATATGQQAVESASAYAYAWRFDDTVELLAPFAFPDDASTDPDAVAELADLAGFFEYDDVAVTEDGRVVTLTGELAVSEFDLLERDDGGENPAGGQNTTPQIAFEFEFERGGDAEWNGDEEERVALTHTGGDNVALDTVIVEYDGTAVAERDGIESTEPAGETWAAGGEWTLRATGEKPVFQSGATVRVVWTSDDGDQSAVLAEATLP
jgi:hypothetical protein